MERDVQALTGATLGGAFQLDGIDWPAPEKGHDRVCWDDDVVLVADGVTPRLGEDADVAGFAERALAALQRTRDRPDARAWFRAAIEACDADRHPKDGRSPFCTVAAARRIGDRVELATLGDSLGIVRHGGETTVVWDDDFGRFDEASFTAMKVAIRAGATFDTARASIDQRLADRRSVLAGLVFSDDPDAAERVVSVTVPLVDISHILLCTDGLSVALDVLDLYATPSALVDAVVDCGLASVAIRVRDAEGVPDSLLRHPRYGRHDDLSAILLTRRRAADHRAVTG